MNNRDDEIKLAEAISCMESLHGTLNDRDNDCLRIVLDAALASQAQQPAYDIEAIKKRMSEIKSHKPAENTQFTELPPAPTMSQFATKAEYQAAMQSQAQQTESKQGCKECDGQTYIHSLTGEYLGECPFCTKEEEPYAYDVPTKDGTELAYALYYSKYKNPLPEGAIPLYTSQQEPVRPWICPNFMLPPRSEEVLVYPMPNNVAHTAFHDGECWRVTEYENNYGYSLVALPDGFIKGWMPLPPAPEGE